MSYRCLLRVTSKIEVYIYTHEHIHTHTHTYTYIHAHTAGTLECVSLLYVM